MAKRNGPNLAPAALGRLVKGMTPKEVEAVVGRYHRLNLHEGRRYYDWIGEGGMLRAFFTGPLGTLSHLVLGVAEEERLLTLRGNLRQRMKNCTIIRTWYCIKCRKRYRCSALPPLNCPNCGSRCEHVPFRVPAPRQAKAWDKFWTQYKAERALLDAYLSGELRESIRLKLFEMHLTPKAAASRRRRRTSVKE